MIEGRRTAVRAVGRRGEPSVGEKPIDAISRARGAARTIVIGSDGIASDRVA